VLTFKKEMIMAGYGKEPVRRKKQEDLPTSGSKKKK